MKELFHLSQRCEGNTRNIRSCCILEESSAIVTGSQDGLICIWAIVDFFEKSCSAKDPVKLNFILEYSHRFCQSPVYSLHGGVLNNKEDFFVGDSKDIYWANRKGNILHTFQGHSNSICSLTLLHPLNGYGRGHKILLVSGSWDGTARVWDLDSKSVLFILSEHAYAVTVFTFLFLSKPYIVTGSQDKTLRFWSWDNMFRAPEISIPHAHTDIIRGFDLLSETELLSCSNDGYVSVWDLVDKKKIASYKLHDTFIFDVCVIKKSSNDSNGSLIVSSSEDHTCRIWSTLGTPWILIQTLKHPATVWKTCVLSNKDIFTICEDGFLRVWTQKPEYALPLEGQLLDYAESEITSSGSQNIDMEKLPSKAALMECRGKLVGESRLCRDGSTIIALSWNGNDWEFVGEVQPNQSKNVGEYYKGDEFFPAGYYDYLLQIQTESYSTLNPLPFRYHDNPRTAAESFCLRENIPMSYVTQIVQFITSNCLSSEKDILPSGNGIGEDGGDILLRDYVRFRSVNMKGLSERLEEIFKSQTIGLSELHQGYLLSLLKKIESTEFSNLELRKCEIYAAFEVNIHLLEAKLRLPIIDIWRIIILHPQSSQIFRNSDSGRKAIKEVLAEISRSYSDPTPLTICCYRFLANLFVLSTNRVSVSHIVPQIIRVMAHPPVKKRTAISSWIALLSNLTLAIYQIRGSLQMCVNSTKPSASHLTDCIIVSLGNGILSILQCEKLTTENLTMLTVALETLVVYSFKQKIEYDSSFSKNIFCHVIDELERCCADAVDFDLNQNLKRIRSALER